jgi:4'-phosphopantetheinyl transferase
MSSPRNLDASPVLWPARPLTGAILPREVHIWAWSFSAADQPREQDLQLLDDDERQRTARFIFMRDRVKYSICHANMRRILASYLHRPPESLTYRTQPGGKPELESDVPLRFNLSHSRSLALLAVARVNEVGVDVEDIRPIEPGVAERFFSAAELAGMADLHGRQWLDAFYRCWTRKEAILKVEGLGLRIPLDSFDVSLRPEEPAALLAARPEAKLTANWSLHHLLPANGAMAALAVGDPEAIVQTQSFVADA